MMEIRPITSEMNILTRSDGSALLTQGNSAVVVNINGPLEVFSVANMDMNKAFIDVNYRPKRGLPGVGERYKEKILKNVCDTAIITSLYPKTQINIQLQEMDDNGGIFACAINACNIALMNSGLEMNFTIAAIHCCIDDDDNVIVDPEYSTEEDNLVFSRVQKPKRISKFKADFTFVFDSIKKSIIAIHTNGKYSLQQYREAEKLCRLASQNVFDFYCELAKKYSTVI